MSAGELKKLLEPAILSSTTQITSTAEHARFIAAASFGRDPARFYLFETEADEAARDRAEAASCVKVFFSSLAPAKSEKTNFSSKASEELLKNLYLNFSKKMGTKFVKIYFDQPVFNTTYTDLCKLIGLPSFYNIIVLKRATLNHCTTAGHCMWR